MSSSDRDSSVSALLAQIRVEQPDEDHAQRCAAYASTLFDGLAGPMGLDPSDRDIAIVAAYLHDVGYTRGGRDHHRKSFDVIRELSLPLGRPDDRILAALAARYHGVTAPSIEHAGFQDLDFDDQRRVRRLVGIVRLAAALDASHLGLVESVTVDQTGGALTIVAHASEEPAIERDRLRTAAASLRTLAGLDLRTDVVVAQ
ncbi:MAG TPA: hypothetical protein DEU95_12820 [Chloroflexi bacterium]|nr:hypothetical protein [Chloroflexota bacterium]